MAEGKPGTSLELRVAGMDCASCAASIEGALKRLDGVGDVQVDVVGGKVRIQHDGALGREAFAAAVTRVGYRVTERETEDATSTSEQSSFWAERGRLISAVASGAALAAALIAGMLDAPDPLRLALLAVSTISGGWFVVPRGLRAALSRSLDMNFLMSLAAAGAWIIGEQAEAAATLFLFAVAELLESYSMDRARNAIRVLMDLSPAEATVRRDGGEARILASDVRVGETVIVRPGEKLPVDGLVISGGSSVNQAPITGESLPIEKEPGADVFAGTLNGNGVLEIRSTKPASDTTLARIIHAVEEAQASRSPSQRFVDRFARVYTPIVVLAAVVIAVAPPLAGIGTWEVWVYRALAMLVVACPCALVISTPVSIVSGLTAAARSGVLIKGGAYLEELAAATTVCFDKTGTLTEGKPAVASVVAFAGSEEALLGYAAAVERRSEHPLAGAIMDEARRRGLPIRESNDFEALTGRGARARSGNTAFYVGNERMLSEERFSLAPEIVHAMQARETAGQTAVAVGIQKDEQRHVLGILGIADRVRPNAATALNALREAGIRNVVMLSGDNAGTAHAIAGPLGITDVRAGLLPADKIAAVKALQAGGERVVFVGDGVNDAPALASANVGLAMGAAGTDVALETADVALMGDDLEKLPRAIHLARRTVRIVKQNIAVALAIKAVFLVLAIGGWATLWMAVAADMGGSLLVVANGLRARRL